MKKLLTAILITTLTLIPIQGAQAITWQQEAENLFGRLNKPDDAIIMELGHFRPLVGKTFDAEEWRTRTEGIYHAATAKVWIMPADGGSALSLAEWTEEAALNQGIHKYRRGEHNNKVTLTNKDIKVEGYMNLEFTQPVTDNAFYIAIKTKDTAAKINLNGKIIEIPANSAHLEKAPKELNLTAEFDEFGTLTFDFYKMQDRRETTEHFLNNY